MSKERFIYFEDSWNNYDMNTEIHYILKVLDKDKFLTEENQLTTDKFKALNFSSELSALTYLRNNNKLVKVNTGMSFFEINHYIVI